MKKIIKLGLVLGFLVAGCFFLFSNPAQATNSLAETVTSPRSLYVQNCARCHGSNGKSQTPTGRKLEADDLTSSDSKGISNAKRIRTITNGRGKMPGFGKKLTAAQISSIAGYIRSL